MLFVAHKSINPILFINMSRQLLASLNGNKTGNLYKLLNDFEDEPRIAWYPSAGTDFRALLYLHPNYSTLFPESGREPDAPDMFLFTDYNPWGGYSFLDTNLIYQDLRTRVYVENIEELPSLKLPLHEDIVCFPMDSIFNGRVFFLEIKIESNRLGSFVYPIIYAFAENEAFYCDTLFPNNATISHLIHVRYGGGCGGGGRASGAWLLNVLRKLKCELYITDRQNNWNWQSGDLKAMEYCTNIPKQNLSHLRPIRTIRSKDWCGHGDVVWNLVS